MTAISTEDIPGAALPTPAMPRLPQRQFRPLLHSTNRHTRIHPRNPGQSRQSLLMNALKVRHIPHNDPQQVIELTGHQVTLHNLRNTLDRLLERRKLTLLLPVQANMHKYVPGQAGMRLADQSRIALDHAALLKRANPPQAGGLREIHPVRKMDIADTAILLQGLENGFVVSVQCHSRKMRKNDKKKQKLPQIHPHVMQITSK